LLDSHKLSQKLKKPSNFIANCEKNRNFAPQNYTIMEIKIDEHEIKLEGLLDSNSVGKFTKVVDEILAGKDNDSCWTIDMSALKYTSSQGLRLFLAFQKGLKANGGELVLQYMRSSVREVFEMTGLISVFRVID